MDAREISIHRNEAKALATKRQAAQRPTRRAMYGLRTSVSAMCDAVRSSRRSGEAIHGIADDSSKPEIDPRGNREVRYRLCELSPRANVSTSRAAARGSSSAR